MIYRMETKLLGPILLEECSEQLTHVWLGTDLEDGDLIARSKKRTDSPLLLKAAGQIEEFLAGRRTEFHLPLGLSGTPFQLQVWSVLSEIPFGTTLTYGQVAERMGNPKAVRAVGGACGRNPIPIIIPCHRVLGANGRLTGFSSGLSFKQTLLQLEHILP